MHQANTPEGALFLRASIKKDFSFKHKIGWFDIHVPDPANYSDPIQSTKELFILLKELKKQIPSIKDVKFFEKQIALQWDAIQIDLDREKIINDLDVFIKSEMEVDNKKGFETDINKKTGIGYIIFHGEKIAIGESSSGKYKLMEYFGNQFFNKPKNIDSAFAMVEVKKDKNKPDIYLNSEYSRHDRKLDLMKGQVKEINRDIKNHIKENKLKNFRYRLSLKDENNTVWLKEKVGRRG